MVLLTLIIFYTNFGLPKLTSFLVFWYFFSNLFFSNSKRRKCDSIFCYSWIV